jgi:hypothetical protein
MVAVRVGVCVGGKLAVALAARVGAAVGVTVADCAIAGVGVRPRRAPASSVNRMIPLGAAQERPTHR